ncbi:hypothetical protein OAX78_00470 [Planctomycetota bacterium]|nr:hypothetical protein [Planctomycetota bacterium]
MSDERLRNLERAYQASGSAADRLRWLEARAGATGDPLHQLEVALVTHDPAGWLNELGALFREERRTATAASEEQRPGLAAEAGLRARELIDRLRVVQAPFFGGTPRAKQLGTDLFLAPDIEAERTVIRVGSRINSRVEFLAGLFARWNARPIPDDPAEFHAAFRATVVETVNWVVEHGQSRDAWFYEATEALQLLYLREGVHFDGKVEEELENLAMTHFHSWTPPPDGATAAFSDATAGVAVRLKFRERYARG